MRGAHFNSSQDSRADICCIDLLCIRLKVRANLYPITRTHPLSRKCFSGLRSTDAFIGLLGACHRHATAHQTTEGRRCPLLSKPSAALEEPCSR